ncbi:tRNA 2-selenouridine(34) synthase MnmH [Clostridium sp.]|uniref:tRNA 2-selenouridine(34) synthase MnmH n=1 Tax=Clostridium sp. TaxID=1506 RepID=UPI00261FE283|nr:tRNA 2-selenouridine(34) synthase MnmH [Clostridium sp.]
MSYPLTKDFKKIVIENIPLLDVRAPIEYEKGAFLNSINIPILNNEERHIIGTCYKEKGNEEATKLGYKLVSGKIKEKRVKGWTDFFKENDKAMLYCFRGGSRSRIAQEWITDNLNKEVTRLEGGYKAFRNYLIEELTMEKQDYNSIILTGSTGSGKTILLNKLDNSLDLEGIANHRGSSFGSHIDPQPSQIDFENNIAYRLINLKDNGFKNIILEDEGRNVGRNFVPQDLQEHFRKGKYIILDVPLEDRTTNTLKEYVTESQKEYIDVYGAEGLDKWFTYIYDSMSRVKKKFGGDNFNIVINELDKAYKNQLSTGNIELHRNWIERFLRDYYDPLYKHSLGRHDYDLLYRGNTEEVYEYLKTLK